jgi:hypothetical protein
MPGFEEKRAESSPSLLLVIHCSITSLVLPGCLRFDVDPVKQPSKSQKREQSISSVKQAERTRNVRD